MQSYFSKYFQILSIKPDAVEIRSKYHYWRILERDNMYFLHHKHNCNDSYHVQRTEPFMSLCSVRKYISNHDEYFKSMIV